MSALRLEVGDCAPATNGHWLYICHVRLVFEDRWYMGGV